MNNFVLLFYSPFTNKIVFLEESADIKTICYSDNPKLPGTDNLVKAKKYRTQEAARNDVFTLRYYHREFILIKVLIIPYDKAEYLFGIRALDTFDSLEALSENISNIK